MSYENNFKNKYWVSKYLDLIFKKLKQLEDLINGSGGGGTLQSILDAGPQATDTYIRIDDTSPSNQMVILEPGGIQLNNGSLTLNSSRTVIGSVFNNTNIGGSVVISATPSHAGIVNLNFPVYKAAGTYTIATESAISGTFANPASITVVNGIITAIS